MSAVPARRELRLAACVVVLLLAWSARVLAQVVPWRSGAAPLPRAAAAQVHAVFADAAAGQRHVVVQFAPGRDVPGPEVLAAQGIVLLRYIGAGAWFATLHPTECDATQLAATTGIAALATVRSEWKLHPALAAADGPEWARWVDPRGEVQFAVYLLLHADIDLAAGMSLAPSGAVVRDVLPSVNGLVLELPAARLADLAARDEVQWIEPALPLLTPTNDGVRSRTLADVVQAPPYGLTGAGVNVLVYDGGTARTTHVDFQGRLLALDSSGTITHATHVAGTIGGAGIGQPLYKGMAPGVALLSYGLQGAGSSGPLYTDPGDLEADFADAIQFNGAMLSNASLGSNVEANGFDCTWQGDYGVTDALIDAIVCGSLGAPFRMVWSAGNERSGSRCDVEGYGDYYSIAPPGGAKNHLTVGAVNSNDDSMTAFSSWGPTDDGRLKPDVCAPGCQAGVDFGVTSCTAMGDSSYGALCGTSMSSPAVCGLAALVLEDFQAHYPGLPLPRNSTLRALFAHTAVDLGQPGPDYQFGYGSVRVQPAVDLVRNAAFVESALSDGASHARTFVVAEGTPVLKVTLAWDDPPAVPNAAVALVNDLDLVVTGPDGTRAYPWTLAPLTPADPAQRTQPDRVNNIEQVLVENPTPGEWTIAVAGYSVPEGPQSYSLVGDGAVNIATVITLPNGVPELVPPGVAYDLDVSIVAHGQEIVPGTAVLMFRAADGAFAPLPLADLGGGNYRATLPPCACDAAPSYYVQVDTTVLGTVTLPSDAPQATFSHGVGVWTPLFTDDFEQPAGWTVLAGAVSGNWERADPELSTNLGVITQPADDHTPGDAYLCYVTGPLAGLHGSAYDVDGGPSHLVSPVFDLAGRDATVEYWRWYFISINTDDVLVVAVSNDGVDWVPVEEVRRSASAWAFARWRVSDFVAPTANVQVRFTVHDTDPGSLIESLVDDFMVTHRTCSATLRGDLNCDGTVGFQDINPFVLYLSNFDAYRAVYPDCDPLNGDINLDGSYPSFADINPFVSLLAGN